MQINRYGAGGGFGCVFFFSSRRRHTRFDCDWSSDVCSSDLLRPSPAPRPGPLRCAAWDDEHQVAVVFGGEGSREGTLVFDPYANTWTRMRDRKSTRLNSSHSQISYAVFCLKKKKKYINKQSA